MIENDQLRMSLRHVGRVMNVELSFVIQEFSLWLP